MTPPASRFTPARVVPPAKPLGALAFVAAFVRNPLEVVPQAAYEEDFVPLGGARSLRAWVTSPAIIKAVLLDERDKFRKTTQIRLLSPLLGKGILTSEGADWKWQRQAAAPMFRPQELAGFVPAFVRAAEALVSRWRDAPPGSEQAIDADMTRVTFEVIAATLLPSVDEVFARSIHRSVRALERSGGWDILYASTRMPKWLPRPGMFAERRAVQALRGTVAAQVREHRAARERDGEGPDDLMHRLIIARDPESGRTMAEEQLVDNLLTFYLAGHDTTAKALTWTLYLLAGSPQWAAALEDEIGRVTGGAAVGSGHFEKLILVQQVLRESMRLYPPVPLMSRQAVADVGIEGRMIRAGTSILMPIYAIHRHVRRWEHPDEFDPERFSRAREGAISRYQYMPFGAGPRVCIGMSFALLEATTILATLLQHARFAPAAGKEPSPVSRVTLAPKGGMPLAVSLK